MKLTLRHWPLLLSLAMVLLATLACGGFQVRVTPAASPSPQAKVQTATPRPANIVTATPTSAPPGTPTAVPTATPPMTTGLAIGKSARVSASGGVNMRDTPSTAGKQVAQLPANSIVTVKDGPKEANDFVWWLIDNGTGSVGWVAMGTKEDPWLTAEKGSGPATSGGKLVSRDVRLGDRSLRPGAGHHAQEPGAGAPPRLGGQPEHPERAVPDEQRGRAGGAGAGAGPGAGADRLPDFGRLPGRARDARPDRPARRRAGGSHRRD